MTLISRLTAAFAVVLFAVVAVAPLPAEGQGSVESDRAALVAIFNWTGGEIRSSPPACLKWLSDKPIGEWCGVQTNDDGRVVQFSLGSYWSLTGPLPPAIGDLAKLQRLYIGGAANSSSLTGSLPPEIGELADLEELTITSHDRLTGPLPSALGNLRNLEKLTLNGNQRLGGPIPAELGRLTGLRHFEISHNLNLTGPIPPELGNLRNLELLELDNNPKLGGPIPSELGRLAKLERLRISRGRISGPIPRELGNLQELKYMHISSHISPGGGLTGSIPPELGRLRNLEELYLGEGYLSGEIPPELGNAVSLHRLYLFENDLTGEIPPELGNLPLSTTLGSGINLQHNRLTGSIPAALRAFEPSINPQQGGVILPIAGEIDGDAAADRAVLEALYDATGGDNWKNNGGWKTDAPLSEWHGVSVYGNGRVRDLNLHHNNLTGEIPAELGNLEGLVYLALGSRGRGGNYLTGEIPPELGNLMSLETLQLAGNRLTGEIPAELGKFAHSINPQYTDDNAIYLPIEGAVYERAVLEAFYDATGGANWTYNNNWKTDRTLSQWAGVNASVVAGSETVTSLELGRNNLTGEIPRELGSLTNLVLLGLHNNYLTGEIPRELGSLTNLERLSLRRNNLTGEIPRELANFENVINPQQNGVILPVEGAGGTVVDPVDSAADRAILEAFYDATGGANWNNSANWKTDRPLSEWYGVTVAAPAAGDADNHEVRVTGLALPDNNLTGEIPRELADLPLETLVLNGNDLTGTIPEELRRFEGTINPQQGGVNLPVGTPVPALPFVGALLLACGLYVMGRRKMQRR